VKKPKHSAEAWLSLGKTLLGKKPDEEVAKILGYTTSYIGIKRRQLKIPPYRGETVSTTPTVYEDGVWEEIDRLLGKIPDTEICVLYGVSYKRVNGRRLGKNIAAACRVDYSNVDWTEHDMDISAKLKVPLRKVASARAYRKRIGLI